MKHPIFSDPVWMPEEKMAVMVKKKSGEVLSTEEARFLDTLLKSQTERAHAGYPMPCQCREFIPLFAMYKCRFCQVWFCSNCAETHFSMSR